MTTISEALQKHVEAEAETAKADYLEQWAEEFAAMQSGDESEAELLLGGFLLTITDGYNRARYRDAWDAFADPDWGTVMGHNVEVDGYLAPFLFRCCYGADRRSLTVTLDSGNGRQRLPSDIARDRGLMEAGCKVLNFTEGDILARPAEIAEEVTGALLDLMDEMLEAAGQIRGRGPTNVTPIGRR